MGLFDDMKKVAGKSFDEAANVAQAKKNPVKAAEAVKKYAERLEKKNNKKA